MPVYVFDVQIAGVTVQTNETSPVNAIFEAVRRLHALGVGSQGIVTAIVNGNIQVYMADRIATTQVG